MTDPWAALCKDRPCIRCGADDETIVPAHANQLRLGKGTGLKAAPWTVIPLCLKCHTWLDNGKASRLETLEAYTQGWNRHMANLLDEGQVEIRGHSPKELARKPIPKILKHPGHITR